MGVLYDSIYSKGDRQSLISSSSSSDLFSQGNSNYLINGSDSNNCYFKSALSKQWMLFVFNEPICIQEITWRQSSTGAHGSWQLKVSNDNINFINIDSPFILQGGSFNFNTNNEYKYYKLEQVDGITSSGPYLYEIEFSIKKIINYFLMQYQNKIYTIKENNIILSPSQVLNDINFKTNGFTNSTIISEEKMNNIFINKTDLKLLLWTNSLTRTSAKINFNIKPYRFIDVLQKQLNSFDIMNLII